jgi:hypothetical protein
LSEWFYSTLFFISEIFSLQVLKKNKIKLEKFIRSWFFLFYGEFFQKLQATLPTEPKGWAAMYVWATVDLFTVCRTRHGRKPVWIPGETRKTKAAAAYDDGWLIQRASQWISTVDTAMYVWLYECDSCIPHNRERGTWFSGVAGVRIESIGT